MAGGLGRFANRKKAAGPQPAAPAAAPTGGAPEKPPSPSGGGMFASFCDRPSTSDLPQFGGLEGFGGGMSFGMDNFGFQGGDDGATGSGGALGAFQTSIDGGDAAAANSAMEDFGATPGTTEGNVAAADGTDARKEPAKSLDSTNDENYVSTSGTHLSTSGLVPKAANDGLTENNEAPVEVEATQEAGNFQNMPGFSFDRPKTSDNPFSSGATSQKTDFDCGDNPADTSGEKENASCMQQAVQGGGHSGGAAGSENNARSEDPNESESVSSKGFSRFFGCAKQQQPKELAQNEAPVHAARNAPAEEPNFGSQQQGQPVEPFPTEGQDANNFSLNDSQNAAQMEKQATSSKEQGGGRADSLEGNGASESSTSSVGVSRFFWRMKQTQQEKPRTLAQNQPHVPPARNANNSNPQQNGRPVESAAKNVPSLQLNDQHEGQQVDGATKFGVGNLNTAPGEKNKIPSTEQQGQGTRSANLMEGGCQNKSPTCSNAAAPSSSAGPSRLFGYIKQPQQQQPQEPAQKQAQKNPAEQLRPSPLQKRQHIESVAKAGPAPQQSFRQTGNGPKFGNGANTNIALREKEATLSTHQPNQGKSRASVERGDDSNPVGRAGGERSTSAGFSSFLGRTKQQPRARHPTQVQVAPGRNVPMPNSSLEHRNQHAAEKVPPSQQPNCQLGPQEERQHAQRPDDSMMHDDHTEDNTTIATAASAATSVVQPDEISELTVTMTVDTEGAVAPSKASGELNPTPNTGQNNTSMRFAPANNIAFQQHGEGPMKTDKHSAGMANLIVSVPMKQPVNTAAVTPEAPSSTKQNQHHTLRKEADVSPIPAQPSVQINRQNMVQQMGRQQYPPSKTTPPSQQNAQRRGYQGKGAPSGNPVTPPATAVVRPSGTDTRRVLPSARGAIPQQQQPQRPNGPMQQRKAAVAKPNPVQTTQRGMAPMPPPDRAQQGNHNFQQQVPPSGSRAETHAELSERRPATAHSTAQNTQCRNTSGRVGVEGSGSRAATKESHTEPASRHSAKAHSSVPNTQYHNCGGVGVEGENFDDLSSNFLVDLRDSTDLRDGGDIDLLELEMELCQAHSIALRYCGDLLDLSEEIETIRSMAASAERQENDLHTM